MHPDYALRLRIDPSLTLGMEYFGQQNAKDRTSARSMILGFVRFAEP
jgi:hypothetical protein